jgi:DNA-binding NarL/FixJ family response regulator
MKKITIALLEDNPTDMSNLINSFSHSNSIDVKYTFLNGSDFLHFLDHKTLEIDIAIIDFRMPVLNGLETYRNLIAKNVKFKLLLVSHGYYSHVMKEIMNMGTQNYCQKNGQIILKALSKLIEGRNIYADPSPVHQWDELTKSSSLALKDESSWLGLVSPLDKKIIRLVCLGLNSIQIATILNYETSSIEKYRCLILKNLCLKNSQQLAAWAFSNELITSSFLFQAQNGSVDEASLQQDEISLLKILKERGHNPSPKNKN